jgi:hypothetical protein
MVFLNGGVGDRPSIGVGVDQQDLFRPRGGRLEGQAEGTTPVTSSSSQAVPPAEAGGTDGSTCWSEGFLCVSSEAQFREELGLATRRTSVRG